MNIVTTSDVPVASIRKNLFAAKLGLGHTVRNIMLPKVPQIINHGLLHRASDR